jgi:hypothetical protein
MPAAEASPAPREGEPRCDLHEAMAHPLRAGASQFAGEQKLPAPREQVVGDQDQLEPDRVHLEVPEGQLRHPGVL